MLNTKNTAAGVGGETSFIWRSKKNMPPSTGHTKVHVHSLGIYTTKKEPCRPTAATYQTYRAMDIETLGTSSHPREEPDMVNKPDSFLWDILQISRRRCTQQGEYEI